MKKELIEYINAKKFDYKEIKNRNIFLIFDSDIFYNEASVEGVSYDINFIITVRGRLDFAEPMYKSFKEARIKSPLKVGYTVVEHSDFPEHSKFCKKNCINYIWIKPEEEKLFNKCLAYNVGALFGPKSKYYIFHDIDCLVQSDFFLKLSENLSNKNCRAMQCFTGRRVLYINENFTPKVVSGEFPVDDLNINMPEVDLPRLNGKVMIGAPGGSILVERDLFFEVGGYDPELFLANSPEDAFFWEKIDTLDKMYISDNPEIELYHMYHPPTWMYNPYGKEMYIINEEFKKLSLEDKKEIIELKSKFISEFK